MEQSEALQWSKGPRMIKQTVGEYEKDQWSRMAQAAYAAGRNNIGHKYSMAASLPRDAQMELPRWDRLMDGWRAWLVHNDWTKAEEA